MCSDVLKTRINVSVDPNVLKKVDKILDRFGLSRSNAVESWFKQVIADPSVLDLLRDYR